MHAYDYIGKPAKKERLFKVMDDVLLKHTEYDNSPKLTFTYDKNTVSLAYQDIVLVRTADRNYLEIIDEAGNTYLTRLTFAEVTEILTKDRRFLLILRGILVNMEYILRFDNAICYMTTGMQLPINVKKARDLENTYQNYRFDSMRNERTRKRER